ncbi:MAG: hypothetical protein M3Y87_33885 [Myxococcota bacterium]|nr:hypothetical protein [Myxococcota bacterium]
MRTRSFFALVAPAVAVLGASCAPAAVIVEMNFPTTAAFNHSEQGRLRIFRLQPDELGVCPALLDGLPTSNFPSDIELAFDSELTSVCAFREGAGVPELEEGPHAYVVEMRSASNDLILTGCRIGEIYAGAPSVRVELHPTDQYPTTTAPASRCGGGT